MKELIQFKRQRELGDVLSDTFKFLRLEYKPLFKALLQNAAVPFVILIAFSAYYNSVATDFTNILEGSFNASGVFISLIGLVIALIFYYGVLYGTILNYIKLYIENEGIVDQTLLKQQVRADLGRLTGLSFLSGLMLLIGFMMCILPGVYISVPLSLSFAVIVFKNKSVIDAIAYSFSLVKGEWWMTFATILVVGLLLYVANVVFSLPLIIYSLVKAFSSTEQLSPANLSGVFDWVYISLNVATTAIQYILAGIFAIAIALIYFNLNEKINQTGTFETIDSIGSDI